VYVIEPYDLRFSSNIEFQIPFKYFNNDEKNVEVLQFQPEDGIYLKLPTTLDTNSRMMRFQSDIAGVFVFVKSTPSVSCFTKRIIYKVIFKNSLDNMDCWCSYTNWFTYYSCYFYNNLFSIKSKSICES
jgi:hypothetical protein